MLLYGGFVVTAMVTTLMAPMLPLLATRWTLTDAAVAYLFPAQFIGSKVGNLFLSAFLIQRIGLRPATVLGYSLMCAGVAVLGSGMGWPAVLVAVFCFGSGVGITTPATNLWISEANPNCRAAKLNLLKLAWSIGAMACPVVLVFCHKLWGMSSFLVGLAIMAGVVAIGIGCATPSGVRSDTPDRAPAAPPVDVPVLFCMIAIFFLYVGVENSLGWWISSLTRRLSGTDSHWMLASSFFWGGLLAGRASAAFILRWFPELRLSMTGLGLAAVGTVGLIVSPQLPPLFLSASITGLGLAPVYPIAIACVTRSLSRRAASSMFLFSGFGGAAMPWIVGRLSTRTGSLAIGLIVPLAAIIAMLGLQALFARDGRLQRPALLCPPIGNNESILSPH